MQLEQKLDGAGKRPLEDVFDAEDQPIRETTSASLAGKARKYKIRFRRRLLPLRHGCAPVLVAGSNSMEYLARWLCCANCIIQVHPTRIWDRWKWVNLVGV